MRYFGTDGIRGKVGDTLTEQLAIKVGKSLSLLNCNKVLIGYDTRKSNHMLKDAIYTGAKSVDKHVVDIGIIPTSGLAYCSLKEKCIGIMITASHNPYFDNGIKIFLNGYKLTDDQENEIEEYIDNCDILPQIINSKTIDASYLLNYQDFLLSLAKNSNLKIGLDLANGATYQVAKNVFDKISNNIMIVANTPNGININEKVGSTHIDNISNLVKQNSLDIGFSFDGDGDRMLVVDHNGKVHTGDEIIYVLATYLKKHNKLNKNKVVLTIMSNLGIIDCLKNNGIDVVRTSVGDRNVLQEMINNNYSLGGENSGHLIQLDYLPTGDGILSALSLLNVLINENKSLDELTSSLIIYPDRIANLKVKDKNVINNEKVKKLVNDYIKEYEGILLVIRASGTEDLIRVSCCYKDYDIMNNVIDSICDLIKSLDK